MIETHDKLITGGEPGEAERFLEGHSQLGGYYCGRLIKMVGDLEPGDIRYIKGHLEEFGELLDDALIRKSRLSN